jgi:hypothetical protein
MAHWPKQATLGKSGWLSVTSTGLMPIIWFGRAAS